MTDGISRNTIAAYERYRISGEKQVDRQVQIEFKVYAETTGCTDGGGEGGRVKIIVGGVEGVGAWIASSKRYTSVSKT